MMLMMIETKKQNLCSKTNIWLMILLIWNVWWRPEASDIPERVSENNTKYKETQKHSHKSPAEHREFIIRKKKFVSTHFYTWALGSFGIRRFSYYQECERKERIDFVYYITTIIASAKWNVLNLWRSPYINEGGIQLFTLHIWFEFKRFESFEQKIKYIKIYKKVSMIRKDCGTGDFEKNKIMLTLDELVLDGFNCVTQSKILFTFNNHQPIDHKKK